MLQVVPPRRVLSRIGVASAVMPAAEDRPRLLLAKVEAKGFSDRGQLGACHHALCGPRLAVRRAPRHNRHRSTLAL